MSASMAVRAVRTTEKVGVIVKSVGSDWFVGRRKLLGILPSGRVGSADFEDFDYVQEIAVAVGGAPLAVGFQFGDAAIVFSADDGFCARLEFDAFVFHASISLRCVIRKGSGGWI